LLPSAIRHLPSILPPGSAGMSSDDADNPHRELARMRDLLSLIQELISRVIRSESAADLFARAFAILFRCVPFDVAAAVMLEQNLDLFIATREGAEPLVDEKLMTSIRTSLAKHIPVSFDTTEIVVVSEHHDLPRRDTPAAELHCNASALLEQDNRTAGLLRSCRRRARVEARPRAGDSDRRGSDGAVLDLDRPRGVRARRQPERSRAPRGRAVIRSEAAGQKPIHCVKSRKQKAKREMRTTNR